MSILEVIALLIGVGNTVAQAVQGAGSTPTGPGTPLEKVLSEVDAAVAALIAAVAKGGNVTAADVEALRVKQLW